MAGAKVGLCIGGCNPLDLGREKPFNAGESAVDRWGRGIFGYPNAYGRTGGTHAQEPAAG
jgi:hypothetical protein